MENFLWHLENHFKCNKVRKDKMKIKTAVLYLIEIVVLWWKQKESKIGKGICAINT